MPSRLSNPESSSIVVLWFNGDERLERKPYANFAGWIIELLNELVQDISVQKTKKMGQG
jgi:hypothetical protein